MPKRLGPAISAPTISYFFFLPLFLRRFSAFRTAFASLYATVAAPGGCRFHTATARSSAALMVW